LLVDGSDICTQKTATGSTRGATDLESTGAIGYFGDVDAGREFVSDEVQSKKREGTRNRNNFIGFIQKRSVDKSKGRGSQIRSISGEGLVILYPLEMLYVGRN
jgi:hypothetical protein